MEKKYPIHELSGKEASRWDGSKFPKLEGCFSCGRNVYVSHIGNDSSKKKSVKVYCKNCNIVLLQSTLNGHFEKAENYVIKIWNTRF